MILIVNDDIVNSNDLQDLTIDKIIAREDTLFECDLIIYSGMGGTKILKNRYPLTELDLHKIEDLVCELTINKD